MWSCMPRARSTVLPYSPNHHHPTPPLPPSTPSLQKQERSNGLRAATLQEQLQMNMLTWRTFEILNLHPNHRTDHLKQNHARTQKKKNEWKCIYGALKKKKQEQEKEEEARRRRKKEKQEQEKEEEEARRRRKKKKERQEQEKKKKKKKKIHTNAG